MEEGEGWRCERRISMAGEFVLDSTVICARITASGSAARSSMFRVLDLLFLQIVHVSEGL